MKPIFVVGYPGHVGGACTELWHTLKLWRRIGLEVHLIPAWGPPYADWLDRVTAIGCTTHLAAGGDRRVLQAIEGLAGGTVVSFCNEHFLKAAPTFCDLGCRIVWVPCMNWLFNGERRHYAKSGCFDAYVCQSRFQRDIMVRRLGGYRCPSERVFQIPGAFDASEFPFAPRPHVAGEPFIAGRLSRAAPDKFASDTWSVLRKVEYRPLCYRIMGFDAAVERQIQKPPPWAECLPCGAESAPTFLSSLHCYCQLSGAAVENWPRVILEAMAAGVPIVGQARGGIPEMIEHGVTGFLGKSGNEMARWVGHFARNEDLRVEVAANARRHLVMELANEDEIGRRWLALFEEVSNR